MQRFDAKRHVVRQGLGSSSRDWNRLLAWCKPHQMHARVRRQLPADAGTMPSGCAARIARQKRDENAKQETNDVFHGASLYSGAAAGSHCGIRSFGPGGQPPNAVVEPRAFIDAPGEAGIARASMSMNAAWAEFCGARSRLAALLDERDGGAAAGGDRKTAGRVSARRLACAIFTGCTIARSSPMSWPLRSERSCRACRARGNC